MQFGHCLRANVTDHPLRPVKDLRLGALLLHLLPNLTQADLKTIYIFLYPFISKGFLGTFPRVTHPFATISRSTCMYKAYG